MRHQRVFWVSFFSLVMLSWAVLFAWDFQPHFLHHLGFHHLHHAHDSLGAIILMWAVMVLAMMLPTTLPFMQQFQQLHGDKPHAALLLSGITLGYVFAWLFFAIPTGSLQYFLQLQHIVDHDGIFISQPMMGGMLLLAGLYQFSTMKNNCVNKCRQPAAFLLMHWRPGFLGSLRLGALHGAYCIGCCWALMMLAFVMGTMNSLGMGLAMLIMTAEKLPNWGKYIDRPLGIGLTSSGLLLLVFSAIKFL